MSEPVKYRPEDIRTVCMICGAHVHGDLNAPVISHGLCKKCGEAELKKYRKKNPLGEAVVGGVVGAAASHALGRILNPIDDEMRELERLEQIGQLDARGQAKLEQIRKQLGRGGMITRWNVHKLRPGSMIYHVLARQGGGSDPLRARITGQVKTWKRSPERFRVPWKHGMYGPTGYVDEMNAREWRTTEEDAEAARPRCPECGIYLDYIPEWGGPHGSYGTCTTCYTKTLDSMRRRELANEALGEEPPPPPTLDDPNQGRMFNPRRRNSGDEGLRKLERDAQNDPSLMPRLLDEWQRRDILPPTGKIFPFEGKLLYMTPVPADHDAVTEAVEEDPSRFRDVQWAWGTIQLDDGRVVGFDPSRADGRIGRRIGARVSLRLRFNTSYWELVGRIHLAAGERRRIPAISSHCHDVVAEDDLARPSGFDPMCQSCYTRSAQ